MTKRMEAFTLVEFPVMSERKSGAFTLVELLVVVAIIALLVSILMPTLSKAKDLTRRVICASNLRNCGTNLHIYAASNDGFFPPHFEWDSSFQSNIYYDWYDENEDEQRDESEVWDLRKYLRPYVGNFEIWRCAALPMAVPIDDSANDRAHCYATYQYFPGRRWPQFAEEGTAQYNNPKPAPDRTSHADATAGRVMMQDTYDDDWLQVGMIVFNHGKGAVINDWGGWITGNPSYVYRLGPLGGAGANLLFYDTHAEWVGSSALEEVGAVMGAFSQLKLYSVLPR